MDMVVVGEADEERRSGLRAFYRDANRDQAEVRVRPSANHRAGAGSGIGRHLTPAVGSANSILRPCLSAPLERSLGLRAPLRTPPPIQNRALVGTRCASVHHQLHTHNMYIATDVC